MVAFLSRDSSFVNKYTFQRYKQLNLTSIRNKGKYKVGQATYESLSALPAQLKKRLYNLFKMDFKVFGFRSVYI